MTKQELLEEQADSTEIAVAYMPLFNTKACIIGIRGVFGIALDIAQVESSQEETMIFAHELGHYFTNSMYQIETSSDIKGKYERKAWEWAVNFLVDFDQLKDYVREGHDVYFIADMMGLHPEVIACAAAMKRDEWVTQSEL